MTRDRGQNTAKKALRRTCRAESRCAWCDGRFQPKRAAHRFCCARCRTAHWEATHPRLDPNGGIHAMKCAKCRGTGKLEEPVRLCDTCKGSGQITPEPINPIARRTDPSSSHEAAELIRGNGTRKTHCEAVLAAVRRSPGRTYRQVASLAKLDPVETMRRLNDLLHADAVRQGEKIRPEGHKVACVSWWPTPYDKYKGVTV